MNFDVATFDVQLYMAPVTNAEKYSECIDFWRSVYGIDSKYLAYLATCLL